MNESEPDYPYGVLEDVGDDPNSSLPPQVSLQPPSPFGAYYDAAE